VFHVEHPCANTGCADTGRVPTLDTHVRSMCRHWTRTFGPRSRVCQHCANTGHVPTLCQHWTRTFVCPSQALGDGAVHCPTRVACSTWNTRVPTLLVPTLDTHVRSKISGVPTLDTHVWSKISGDSYTGGVPTQDSHANTGHACSVQCADTGCRHWTRTFVCPRSSARAKLLVTERFIARLGSPVPRGTPVCESISALSTSLDSRGFTVGPSALLCQHWTRTFGPSGVPTLWCRHWTRTTGHARSSVRAKLLVTERFIARLGSPVPRGTPVSQAIIALSTSLDSRGFAVGPSALPPDCSVPWRSGAAPKLHCSGTSS